jgi:Asp/Glu/hydantoin racemase
MTRLLIINPNTTVAITALLHQHAHSNAGRDVSIEAVSAKFGAPYIACEASYAIAGHAALDALSRALSVESARPDVVLIGCFGDPGLLALQQVSPVPVTGLAQASFKEAAAFGRFAIVTGGERWKPMLYRLAHGLGYGELLAEVITVAPSGAQLAQDPITARQLLAQACQQAAQAPGVKAVILGGAGLAGLAAQIESEIQVPLIDSVAAGLRQSLILAKQAPHQSNEQSQAWHDWVKVSQST